MPMTKRNAGNRKKIPYAAEAVESAARGVGSARENPIQLLLPDYSTNLLALALARILSEDFCYERRRIFVTRCLEAGILSEDFCYERLRSRDPKLRSPGPKLRSQDSKRGFLLRTACHTPAVHSFPRSKFTVTSSSCYMKSLSLPLFMPIVL